LYFHPSFIHAHIILWINDVDVDRITNEIVAMVLVIIDEQFKKFILPDNEHDLTLFKVVEQKQMHQCGSRRKINKHIGTCKYGFPNTLFVKQHAAKHPITQRWVKEIQINYAIFELISRILSYLYLCNQQSLLLRETLILFLQKNSYFEHLIFKDKKSSKRF
jgi:hypothetical protein